MVMKTGDRVKLKYDPGDLRYPVTVGGLGTIGGGPYDANGKPWYWVEWDEQPDEAAMRHWPEELEKI